MCQNIWTKKKKLQTIIRELSSDLWFDLVHSDQRNKGSDSNHQKKDSHQVNKDITRSVSTIKESAWKFPNNISLFYEDKGLDGDRLVSFLVDEYISGRKFFKARNRRLFGYCNLLWIELEKHFSDYFEFIDPRDFFLAAFILLESYRLDILFRLLEKIKRSIKIDNDSF